MPVLSSVFALDRLPVRDRANRGSLGDCEDASPATWFRQHAVERCDGSADGELRDKNAACLHSEGQEGSG